MQGTRPLLVKFHFLRFGAVKYPHPRVDQGEIWQGVANFTLISALCYPLQGEKPKNRPVR